MDLQDSCRVLDDCDWGLCERGRGVRVHGMPVEHDVTPANPGWRHAQIKRYDSCALQ